MAGLDAISLCIKDKYVNGLLYRYEPMKSVFFDAVAMYILFYKATTEDELSEMIKTKRKEIEKNVEDGFDLWQTSLNDDEYLANFLQKKAEEISTEDYEEGGSDHFLMDEEDNFENHSEENYDVADDKQCENDYKEYPDGDGDYDGDSECDGDDDTYYNDYYEYDDDYDNAESYAEMCYVLDFTNKAFYEYDDRSKIYSEIFLSKKKLHLGKYYLADRVYFDDVDYHSNLYENKKYDYLSPVGHGYYISLANIDKLNDDERIKILAYLREGYGVNFWLSPNIYDMVCYELYKAGLEKD